MEETKFKDVRKTGILGIFGNVFLLIIKTTIGFTTHSQSMIADSINSASDILASLMTFIGNKIASEPKDNTHDFGHGKAEYIFSMFISLTMLILSLKTLFDSALSLVYKKQFIFSNYLIIVCLATIATKFLLYVYTKKMYKKHDNILLKSAYKDHRNDCVITTCTLISILASLKGIFFLDGIVGIGISVWIFVSGLEIFIESYNVLMDHSLDEKDKEYIMNLVKEHENIKGILDLYAIPTGYDYVVIFTIQVDGNMSTFESHTLAEHLENDIEQLNKISKAIVHVNPV